MNNRNKLIELFIYIAIVMVGVVLLMTSNGREKQNDNLFQTGGVSHAIVLDE